ncbi:MAG: hypothetical protein ACXABO_07100 [Promethearchaeota archaeon]|jgi:chromatin segregation and condensation protein Rec8/ScpA/Scc1 (kleisin family)
MNSKDFSVEINEKIKEIQNLVSSGEISLLDTELAPIFENLKDSLNVHNINNYSRTYKDAFILLNHKFEELRILLSYLDNSKKFMEFAKRTPDDQEIYSLFEGCWREPFNIKSLSINFLETSTERLSRDKGELVTINHLEPINIKGNFLLAVPQEKFTDKIARFYNKIKPKLPCLYEKVFEEEHDQLKIYENFVYLLHLLQVGKIKYQKETNFLYI